MYGPIMEMLHAKACECDHILYTLAYDRKCYLFILDCFFFFFFLGISSFFSVLNPP